MSALHGSMSRRGVFWPVLAAAVLLLTGAAIAVVVGHLRHAEATSRAAAPAAPISAAAMATCPASHARTTAKAHSAGSGSLVTVPATTAVLCEYEGPSDVLTLTRSRPAREATAVIAQLNGLPEVPSADGNDCLLSDGPEYVIALGGGGSPANVAISPACGTAATDGAVRQLTSVRQLLDLWPAA